MPSGIAWISRIARIIVDTFLEPVVASHHVSAEGERGSRRHCETHRR
jgi:hypothetical protein